jgi:hypothetical protein
MQNRENDIYDEFCVLFCDSLLSYLLRLYQTWAHFSTQAEDQYKKSIKGRKGELWDVPFYMNR